MKKKLFSLSLALFLFSFLPSLPTQAAESIAAIEISGNKKTDTATLLQALSLHKGSAYSRELAHENLKKLYRLGLFSDIQIEKENTTGGVRLTFHVTEKPAISKIVIQGEKEVSEEKILEEITQKTYQILDEKKVGESKRKIKELYIKEGMGLALITSELKPSSDGKNEVELHFKITENKGMKVRKISFEGNKVFSTRKLKGMMKTKESGLLSFVTGSGKYRDEAIERDVAFITYQYLNRGYLKVQVDKPEPSALTTGSGIELKFRVHEGEKFKVHNIRIEGDILTTEEELLSHFDTLKGNYYSQKLLEEDLLKLQELYGNQGYVFANIRPRPLPDDEKKEVDIVLSIEKGQKTTIERINISGNTTTRDKVIRRELKIVENSLYNETLVRKSKAKLESLGYFESVEFSTPRGSSDDKVVLNIQVKEKPTRSFSVGAGFSSVESFLFNANVTETNFLGRGVSASLLAEVSKKRQQFSFEYNDPHFFDTNWIFRTTGFKLLTHYDDFTRDSFGGEVSFGHYIFDNSAFTLGYKIEDVQVDDFSLVVPEFFKRDANGLTSSIVANLQRDTRNNRMIATRGSYNQVSAEYAGLGGDNNFFRIDANSRWFFPVPFPKNSVLKANARIGYIKSLNDAPVPLFERYFTGGINSLRGFSPRSIGPSLQIPPSPTEGDTHFVYGGNKLLVFNVEYEFPIYEAGGFRGVIFADAGNSFAEDQDLNPLKIRSDYGFGLRWLSPLGPLRFEWGLPFKRKQGEDPIVFNFTIGSFF